MMQKVAFQGEKGAFSEKAALEYFGTNIELQSCRTFKEVFECVETGQCSAGIIPIENSLTGSVHQNYDLLLQHELLITGEIYLKIVHCLMALPGVSMNKIEKVYSHPQALEQCQEFLSSWSGIEIVPTYDTAGSAKILVEQNLTDGAAIASEQAARDYGLCILKKGIESNHENYTRFLVLGKENQIPEKDGKTSIVFSFKDIPGALFKSLSVFALRDINLLKIESRPLHGSPWKYFFYLDFEGSMREEASRNAVNHLKEITTFLKILGSYPRGREVE
ncbi:MAG: prephenate dehydratase [Calditrichaeota bacterium]|nr:MAG: prephenate dehydratase [Calditrichota bacterium]